jgi:hypothetical protein
MNYIQRTRFSGVVTQVVEHLLSVSKALSSIPSTAKIKKKKICFMLYPVNGSDSSSCRRVPEEFGTGELATLLEYGGF